MGREVPIFSISTDLRRKRNEGKPLDKIVNSWIFVPHRVALGDLLLSYFLLSCCYSVTRKSLENPESYRIHESGEFCFVFKLI